MKARKEDPQSLSIEELNEVGGTRRNLLVFVTPRIDPTADYDADGFVDAADYTVWRDQLG